MVRNRMRRLLGRTPMNLEKRYSPPQYFLLRFFLCSALLTATVASAQNKTGTQEGTPKYRNPTLTVEERVADLLPRMTLEEKVERLSGGGGGGVKSIDASGQ